MATDSEVVAGGNTGDHTQAEGGLSDAVIQEIPNHRLINLIRAQSMYVGEFDARHQGIAGSKTSTRLNNEIDRLVAEAHRRWPDEENTNA